MDPLEMLFRTLAVFFTMAIFSFLWKDNMIYKFAEHLVVGISMGYWVIILYQTSFLSKMWQPMMRTFHGTPEGLPDKLVFVPIGLGFLLFTRFFPKISWLARIPMAFILGVGSGVAIPLGIQTSVIQQIHPTMAAFQVGNQTGFLPMFNATLVFLGVICGLAYFFFSARHTGILGGMSKVGIWVLMIGFGASFGYTVMSRVSLLYGRMNYLVFDWVQPLVRSVFH
jgi:hypothetical protein